MKTIALSLSESPDIAQRGLSDEHLTHASLEVARYLIDAGHRLAYGGDFRAKGFTEHLLGLVALHGPPGEPPYRTLASFLAWPHYLTIPSERRDEWRAAATLIPIPPPTELGIDPSTPPAADAMGRYACARALTAMRRAMSAATDARVLCGGQLTGYPGLLPGLAEEMYWALRDGKPLFPMGGFGGATAALIEALRGGTPEALTRETRLRYVRERDGDGPPLDDVYRTHGEGAFADLDLIEILGDHGTGSLHNGLSASDNERLFETVDPLEAAVLILQGLAATSPRWPA